MSPVFRFTTALTLVAVALAAPTDLWAQAGDPQPASVRRPYRGLFGAPSDPSTPQSLIVNGSVYGAYDDNVAEGLSEGHAPNSWLQRSGTYWGANGGLDYTLSKPGERFSFGGRGTAQLQYRDAEESSGVSPYVRGEVHMDARLTRSTTLGLSQSASYTPNYANIFTPIVAEDFDQDFIAVPNPDDYELFPLQTIQTASRVMFSQAFGRNITLAGNYQFRTMDIDEAEIEVEDTENSTLHDYRSHSGGASIGYKKPFSANATLVLGYGIRGSDGRGNSAEPRLMHNVNAGVDYSRALSFSRRTTLGFSTGSAIVASERLQVDGNEPRTKFHLLGNATLTHELGRTWTAQLAYARTLVSRDGVDEMYSTDGLTASIDGLVSRRLSVHGSGMWSLGTLDQPGQNRHKSASVTAQINYALTQYLALYTRYLYYQYEFDEGIPLDPRIARAMDRQGVRVGLTTSIPLIR